MSSSASKLLLGCAAAALSVSSAFAQDTAPESAGKQSTSQEYAGLDEILVIGVTKQAENLQTVPTAITAFSGESLQERGATEVRDVAIATPGLALREGGNNPTAFTFTLRGQVQSDNLATLEPSVGVYLDEMYVARAYGLNSTLLDIASVQVLKGPQGTLFGRNTSAGAVLIQTADPEFNEFSGLARGTYGRFDQLTGEAMVNLGFNDTIAVRGAFVYDERDGYQKDMFTGESYAARKTVNGRVKVAIRPIEDLTLLFSGEWYDNDIKGPARVNLFFGTNPQAALERSIRAAEDDVDLVAVTDPSATKGRDPRGLFNEMETETYIAKATLATFFGEVKWINGYRKIVGDNALELDGTAVNAIMGGGSQNLEQFSSEFQVTGSAFRDVVDFAAGITYFRETGFDKSRSNVFNDVYRPSDALSAGGRIPDAALAPLIGEAEWSIFRGVIENDSYGIYGQTSVHVTDQLTVTGGLRYSIDDKGIRNRSGSVVNDGNTFVICAPATLQQFDAVKDCDRGRHDTWNNLSYTIGADYEFTDDIMAYAKHSKGYRAGAQQLRSLTFADSIPADPEIVFEQEVGLKTQFWDRRVRVNVAGYHNKVKGAQRSSLPVLNGQTQTVLENADTETWGAEADISVSPFEGLDIYASGALTDTKYVSYEGFAVGGTAPNQVLIPVDKSGERFIAIPDSQFAIGANYRAQLGFGRLELNANYSWTDEIALEEQTFEILTGTGPGQPGLPASVAQDIMEATTADPVGLTNVRAALIFGPEEQFEIAAWGRNIFDERNPVYGLAIGTAFVGALYNEPATYGVTATVRFGAR